MLALTVGFGAVTAPLRIGAAPRAAVSSVSALKAAIYIYDSSGSPVLMPEGSILDGGAYTDSSFLGTITESYNIVNVSGVIVGYVEYPGPGE